MTDFGRTVGDARKNRMHDADGPNTGPDAETVPVPRALVEALREALGQIPAEPVEREGLYPTLYWSARALVDAVEQPTAGEDEPVCPCGQPVGVHVCGSPSPADPVSEARCRCGHERRDHRISDGYCGANACCGTEKCDDTFTPDPPPTTPREELADAFHRTSDHDPADLNELAGLIIDGFDGFVSLTDRYATAVLILESDWLRKRDAAKWDEGAESGLADSAGGFTPNPYGENIYG